ncbi:MAG: FlgD immunoglobulin-like domain containing protein [Candidatus Neomarinimicrobiota bacterium]
MNSDRSIANTSLILVTLVTGWVCASEPTTGTIDVAGPYLGQDPPGNSAQLFAPVDLRSNSEWRWHGAAAFSADGLEFFIDIYDDNIEGIRIRYMEADGDIWTEPQTASFSNYDAASPSLMDDDNKIYFVSGRPNGLAYGVWSATRTESGWAAPVPVSIPPVANLMGGWEISIARDETLYLRLDDMSSNTETDIYEVRKVNGSYLAPVRLDNNVNSPQMEIGPFVDPDGDYLIFNSFRPGGFGGMDLYICFSDQNGSWMPAVNLGSAINSSSHERGAFVTTDGLYLFFISDRPPYGNNPYWISASIIDNLRPLATDESRSGELPEVLRLAGNYPNPFNPTTTIDFELPANTVVQLGGYDLLGQEIAQLAYTNMDRGFHSMVWNGRTSNGMAVPTGTYIARLVTPEYSKSIKMVLLK